MRKIYLKYWDKQKIKKRGILFFMWRIFYPYRKGDGQYTQNNLDLALKATRLYLLSEFKHLAKSKSY